ncbi:MAG: ATP-binding protein, partial [Clostridia bacterium]|nr:ATP-binding protein [Clostridia bacterium]
MREVKERTGAPSYFSRLINARDAGRVALRITTIYMILGFLWILLSDRSVDLFIKDRSVALFINIAKGWVYVVLSGLIIYLLVHAAISKVQASEEKIRAINEELEENNSKLRQVNQILEETNSMLEETNAALEEEMQQRIGAEEELRESEERYRAMFQNMTNGVAVYETMNQGEDFIFKDFNAASEKIGNLRKEDVVGKRILEVYPNMDKYGLLAVLKKVYQTGIPQYLPAAYYEDQRRKGWRENHMYKLPSGDVVAIYNDVTEQKKAELELKNSEERLRLAMEATSDGLWDWQPITDELYWSPRNYTMLGYAPDEFKVDSEIWKKILHPDDIDESVKRVAKCAEEGIGSSFALECRVLAKDGRWHWIMSRGKAVSSDASNRVTRIIGTHSDITDRKQMEMELLKAKEQAEAANIAKSQFLANMSHEIRTPMNGVIGVTSLLLMGELTKEQREWLELLKKSSDSLLRIINDVLDYSKIEAGKVTLEKSQFKLKEIVEDVVSLFHISARQKHIGLETAFEPHLPEVVFGDAVRLRQILSNLIGNAIKFTEKGRVELSVRQVFSRNDFAKLQFTVKDTGIGIPKVKQGLLFERFNQLDSSYAKQYQGTGLGLAISKKLVEMMNGEIGVESEEGAGSTFYFTVVFSTSDHRGNDPSKDEQAYLMANDERKKRILMAEDDEISGYLLETFLRKFNLELLIAEDGEQAFELYKNEAPDLILTDIQ